MTTYTNAEILTVASEIVAEYGADYLYPGANGCTYTNEDDTPSCLVGHIVARLDPEAFERVIREETARGATNEDRCSQTWSATAMNRRADTNFTDAQLMALCDAQERQDCGDSWGYALEALEAGLS